MLSVCVCVGGGYWYLRPHKIDSMFYLSWREHYPQIWEKLHKLKKFLSTHIAFQKIPEVKHRIYIMRPNVETNCCLTF